MTQNKTNNNFKNQILRLGVFRVFARNVLSVKNIIFLEIVKITFMPLIFKNKKLHL
jgi:hypothetical protein